MGIGVIFLFSVLIRAWAGRLALAHFSKSCSYRHTSRWMAASFSSLRLVGQGLRANSSLTSSLSL